jgi:hypothetical protein
MDTLFIVLSIVMGTLFAIVYCLRVLVLMERRVARIEIHIENLATRILSEELKIEREEKEIEKQFDLLSNKVKPVAVKKKKTKKAKQKK